MTEATRRWLLRGPVDAVAATLDRLTVRTELRGVVEGDDGSVDVAFDLPPGTAAPAPAEGCAVEELEPPDPAAPPATGLENDAPVRVAPDLVVRPPWVAAPPGFAGVELVVPRGMAFGSGEHGSTRAALLLLHETLGASGVALPDDLLDVGCGSGILLRYAADRGVAGLAGCDVEEPAVRATRELVPAAAVRWGGPEVWAPAHFAAVVANLDARQLAAALPAILARWSRRGPLVLGGMRGDEVDVVTGGGRIPADLDGESVVDGWVARRYVGVRRGGARRTTHGSGA